MAKKRHRHIPHGVPIVPATPAKTNAVTLPRFVSSLLDEMQDGREYESIVGCMTGPEVNLTDEVVRALEDVQSVRGRPVLAYCGNVVRADSGLSGVDTTDDLPFAELVGSVPSDARAVDLVLSTRGGNAHQISRFVNALRARFDEVDFLVPSYAMRCPADPAVDTQSPLALFTHHPAGPEYGSLSCRVRGMT